MQGYNETITIWNTYANPTTKKTEFYRHVVENCQWDSQEGVKTSGTTLAPSSKYQVNIAENPLYKNFIDWQALTTDDKNTYFTVNKQDLVARGEWTIEITNVSPYTQSGVKGMTQPYSFTVDNIQELLQGYKQGRHIEITGV